MIGLDSNILVQLAIADHPGNPSAAATVTAEAAHGEFLHVVTDPRRIQPPLTMSEAIAWLQDFLSNPSIALLHSSDQSIEQAFAWMQKYNLGRKRILDTHLAAILYTNNVPLNDLQSRRLRSFWCLETRDALMRMLRAAKVWVDFELHDRRFSWTMTL